MCGIVGFIDPELSDARQARAVLEQMRGAIRHRGPDDEGQVLINDVGLGIQRLSIIDLATGHQPMASKDGRVWIVFNGEIYNHSELRARHETSGRVFQTRSDTEVILAQYERFGLRGIDELNGMFSFAIWDGISGELHLVRDRLGVKPLYYFKEGPRLYFGSEIKALLASNRLKVTPDLQSVWDFLTFRYVPAPRTIWSGICKLPPGHVLTIGPDDISATPCRYWDIPYVQPDHTTVRGTKHQFAELLKDSVRIRMLADVPVGVFLSGGLDSSLIAASVDRSAFPNLKTFAVAIQDAGEDDERSWAKLVANHLHTDHHEVIVSAREYIDFLPKVPVYTDEPLADPTCVPIYYLSHYAREHVKVVLSGEGADEIFAGYSFDQVQRAWDEYAQRQPESARKRSGLFSLLQTLRSRQKPLIDHAMNDQRSAEVPLHITNYLSSEEKRVIFKNGLMLSDSFDVLRRDIRRVQDPHPLHQSLYLYCQNWLVEDLLMKADKMTMAASLELRTPFLDYRIVEWAARTPPSTKVRRLPEGRYVTKAVVRDYAADVLPSSIVQRPKKGFPVPIFRWFSNHLRPLIQDSLCDNPKLETWLERSAIRAVVEAGISDTAPDQDRHRLWNLLVLELWARAWL